MSRHLDDKIRAECLAMMLSWTAGPSNRETAQIDSQDAVCGFFDVF